MPEPEPELDDAPARRWRRWRTAVIMLPLLAGLVVVAGLGARLLWATAPSRHEAAVDVCWNGDERPAGTCTLPSGTAGLAYVFPGFDRHQPDCHARRFRDTSTDATEWHCISVVRGHRVEVAYRMRPSDNTGLGYLRALYAGSQEETSTDGARAIWRPEAPDGSGRYVFATAYLDYPYTLTLWAQTPQLRDRAVERLARFRPIDEITGRRRG